jgi:cytochrome bd-type quinol oxidase subunit 2
MIPGLVGAPLLAAITLYVTLGGADFGAGFWLFDRLIGRGLPLVLLAGVCGLVVLANLTSSRLRGLRSVAAVGVAAVVWRCRLAQHPTVLPGTSLNVSNACAPGATVDTSRESSTRLGDVGQQRVDHH